MKKYIYINNKICFVKPNPDLIYDTIVNKGLLPKDMTV